MASFTRSDDLRGATFYGTDLTDARFVAVDLCDVVVRGSEVLGTEIDSPWLFDGGSLVVNGVDVVPLVDAELNRRFPGRADRRATDPEGLRSAWAALQAAWTGAVDRVAAMSPGTVDVSVDGEWSFAQTLRHLVMATDTWLGKAILHLDQPYHRFGLANAGAASEGLDVSVFAVEPPTFEQVLAARAHRTAMVEQFLRDVTAEELTAEQVNPWAPQHRETSLSCVHTILEEEWEHYRYAVRDLDAIAANQ